MDVGERIRLARTSRKLTVRALGKIVGVSGSAVSQWEAGKSGISAHKAVNLSEALDIPITDLMPRKAGGKEESTRDSDEMLLLERFRLLPKQLQEAYLRFLVIQSDPYSPDGGRR